MSRTLNDDEDERTAELDQANATFGELILRGRSYSGSERNCCFLNTGPATAGRPPDGRTTRFANISAISGIDLPDDGRALVTVDWDHDGDLDIWVSNRNAPRLRFFRNDVPSENHFLTLRLQGDAGKTNRDAIGARVEVVLKDGESGDAPTLPLIQTLNAGDSFLSQSSKWLHFGLGDADSIECVHVRWPGGEAETFTGLEVDRRYRLVQGSAEAARAVTGKRELAIEPGPVELPEPDQTARLPLATLLPMADLEYNDFEGDTQELPIGDGKPVLLNLWASWCAPCLSELKEMATREGEIRDAGIEVVALSVDGLGDDRSDPAAARKMARRLDLPFATGHATGEIVAYLQTLHDRLLAGSQSLPVPVSFLIDGDGRVAVIYKGRFDIDDLKIDIEHTRGTLLERFARSAPIAGRTLPVPTVSRERNQFEARYRHATYLQQRGFPVLAAAENRALIELFPDNAGVHNNLGISYVQRRQLDAAEASFREALRIQPDDALAHTNLGTLLVEQRKFAEAAGHFEKAIASNPGKGENHVMLGRLLLELKRWDEAQSRLEQAVKLKPRSADAHAHLGYALAQQGQLQQAADHLERALQIQPEHRDARQNLAAVRRMMEEGG